MITDPKQRVAMTWLSNEITRIPNFKTRNELETSITVNGKKIPPLCEIALFKYSATFGNKNGYWDKYPIVLIVRPLPEHFFGFNLHYIEPEMRKKIIDVVTKIVGESNGSNTLKFKYLYPFLDAMVKSKQFNDAYKNYNYANLESKFVIINPDYYAMVSELPIATLKSNVK